MNADTSGPKPRSRSRLRRWFAAGGVVVAVLVAAVAVTIHRSARTENEKKARLRVVDDRIGGDIEILLQRELTSLPPEHEIVERFGRFVSLEGAMSGRGGRLAPNRVVFIATAHFERARSNVEIRVDNGPTTRISSLTAIPSAKWVRENSAEYGPFTFEVIDGWMWMKGHGADQSQGRCSIDGAVEHPHHLYGVE